MTESGHAEACEAGKLLVALHHFRIKADYVLANEKVGTPDVAIDCVEMTVDIRSILGNRNSDVTRQAVKAGIEAYLRKIGQA